MQRVIGKVLLSPLMKIKSSGKTLYWPEWPSSIVNEQQQQN